MEAFTKIKNIAIVVCIVAIAALTCTTFSSIDENQRLETQRNGMLAHAYELSSQLGRLEKENKALRSQNETLLVENSLLSRNKN